MLSNTDIKVLGLLDQDPAYQKYFFSKSKELKWFNSLKTRGYFAPDNIPKDSNSNYLFWDVLEYLEKISSQLNNDSQDNSEYGKKILGIINDLVEYSKKRPINNIHIWWYVIKIICNIPDQLLVNYFDLNKDNTKIDTFKTWLETTALNYYTVDLVLSEIKEKLLPKCLSNPNLNKLTPIILDIITRPYPITVNNKNKIQIKAYHVLGAFEQNLELLGTKVTVEGVQSITKNLKVALEYYRQETKHKIVIDNKAYLIKVTRKKNVSSNSEIYFEPDSFYCGIYQYSKIPPEGKNIVDQMILSGIDPDTTIVEKKLFQAKNKENFSRELLKVIKTKIPENMPKNINEKIEDLYKGISQDYSSIWLKSLKEGSEHPNQPEEVLSLVLRDLLNEFSKNQPTSAQKVLKEFMDTDIYPFSMFRRLMLFSISENFEQLSILFSEVLKKIIFHDSNCEIELFDLLCVYGKDNNKKLQTEKINKQILACVNDVPGYYKKHEDKERMTAFWKFKWLSALKDTEFFKKDYKEAKKESESKNEQYQPDRKGTQTGWVKDTSPLTVDEILVSPPETLIDQYFNKTDWVVDKWIANFEKDPNKDGLKETLKQAAIKQPSYFTDNQQLFAKIPVEYLRFIIRGLTEHWKNKQKINWKDTIELCSSVIRQDIFKTNITNFGYESQGFIKEICSLIDAGCKNDDNAFPKNLKDNVESLFNSMTELPLTKIQPEIDDDVLIWALNSVIGNISRSYIYFSLWVKRNKIEEINNWGDSNFERIFNLGLEPHVWLGQFLVNFNYLDKKYTKTKVESLNESDINDKKWHCFMEGYLGYSNLQPGLFEMMFPHYKKLKNTIIFNNNLEKRYIRHLTYFYLKGNLELEKDSLFYDVLMNAKETKRLDLWIETANYLWSISPKTIETESLDIPKDVIGRILEFWEWTYNHNDIKNLLGEEKYRQFMSKLGLLLIYVKKLDKQKYDWMLNSIPYLEEHHNTPYIIQYMTRYTSTEELHYVGNLFIELLKTSTPSYDKDHILLIVRRLYESKDTDLKKMADEICNTYGRRGNHMLRNLLENFDNE